MMLGNAAPGAGRRIPVAAWISGAVLAIVIGVVYFAKRSTPMPPAASQTADPNNSQTTVPPATAAPSAPTEKSVAVLAFADLSEKKDSEYFSDGVSEDLLDALAKVPGLRVAARTSAFFFKGKNVPIPEIAAKLNVAYVVEGSVQRAGDNVRITAQLIKAADGYHVWSEHFDRELKNVFAVQDEIAGLIAKQLSLKLGASSAAATAAVNPQAFELYMQARQAWNLRTEESFARAEDLLNRALALEPNFARAHAALADVGVLSATMAGIVGNFGQRNDPMVATFRRHIDRALALDPNLAEAHTSLGNLLLQTWHIEDAVRELRLAISLNPNYATAHQWLGRALLNDGRIEEAEAAMRRATELDPLSHRIWDNYAIALDWMNRRAEALAADERALALQPDSLQARVFKAQLLSLLGRHDEAVTLLRQLPWPQTIFEYYAVGVFHRAGSKAEADQAYALLAAGHSANFKYLGLAVLGRYDEALNALSADGTPVQPSGEVLFRPDFDPMRNDPRFKELLATLGMTEAHARAQAWRAAHPLPKTK
jgi:TolB-like protein/lipoprotein NlpI